MLDLMNPKMLSRKRCGQAMMGQLEMEPTPWWFNMFEAYKSHGPYFPTMQSGEHSSPVVRQKDM